jgi:hypothetical protein
MLRPRASDMTVLAVPGSLAARSADKGRLVRKSAAPMRPAMTQATLYARLRLASHSAPAAEHSQQPAAPAATRRVRRSHGTPCPARRRGFPTIPARAAGRPRGTHPGCRQTPRWRETAPATPYVPARCRGGGTSSGSSDRTGRGPTRPRPAPSPPAGPADRATMTAPAGRSEAGERLSMAPGGKRSAGRANGQATPVTVQARPDRPCLRRGRRLGPERGSGRSFAGGFLQRFGEPVKHYFLG